VRPLNGEARRFGGRVIQIGRFVAEPVKKWSLLWFAEDFLMSLDFGF
jgi:hypothetical protein